MRSQVGVVAVLCAFVACGGRQAPRVAGPPIASSAAASAPCAADDAVPAPDAALARWQAIVADDMRPPAGTTAAALVPELVAYLGSPDPVRRDRIAYDVLARWVDRGTLAPAEVRALAATLVRALREPISAAAPDGVFRRSFSALVLAAIVRRDAAASILDDAARRDLLQATRAYAERETDLRGHIGARGWVHAAAHTADLLAQLMKLPLFTPADRGVALEAVARFTVRRHGVVLAYGEDGRLAAAVLAAARAGLDPAQVERWLATLAAPLTERATPVFDAGLFAAQRNARNLLFTLYTQLSLATAPTPGEQQLLAAVRALLAA